MILRLLRALAPMAALMYAVLLTGCDTYYQAPPSVSVVIQPGAAQIPLVTASGAPGTVQFTAYVYNTKNTSVTWFVSNGGQNVPGGNSILGTINNSGLYTAPAVLPSPNTLLITAVSNADSTRTNNVPLTLLNPTAAATGVTILNSSGNAVATAVSGQSYTLDITGKNFYPSTSVQLSQAQTGTPTFVSSTEIKVPVHILGSGPLALQITNASSQGTANPTTVFAQPSTPAASSSIAVVVEQVPGSGGTSQLGSKAYVPRAAANSISIVAVESGTKIGTVSGLPAGFNPTATAANPAADSVVAISATSTTLLVINAKQGADNVVSQFSVPVSGSVSFSDGSSCTICAVAVDSARNRAILDTAAGYLTVDLSSGAASSPIAAAASENFAHDYNAQRIYAPFYNSSQSGLNVIDLTSGTVSAWQNTSGIASPQFDAAAVDPLLAYSVLSDEAHSTYALLNANGFSPSGGTVSFPSATFQITTGCPGAWDGVTLETSSHLGFLGNGGNCVAVAALPSSSINGTPAAPTNFRWANLGADANGVVWTNAPAPHSYTAVAGLDGKIYGLALRQDTGLLARVDLNALLTAPAPSSPVDSNQVNPASAVVFIPLP